MTDAAAISGTFAEFKTVKTRSVAQIVVEVAIEDADRALKALGGVPQPGQEKHVAVARMTAQREVSDAEPIKERRKFEDLKRSQQAGMLCQDARFQTFMKEVHNADITAYGDEMRDRCCATSVRQFCGVNTRAAFDTNELAAAKWDTLHSEYVQWCSQ